jgi:pimeloyl-ACP methyl ester carboxylesterase
MMERIAFKNSRNLNIVGHLHRSKSRSMIILCHGFTSDKSSRGRFDRFAQTFNQNGYGVLAFDFSGCGESDDNRLTLAKLVDDLKSAIKFVKSTGYDKIALYGHSLGSRVCLEAFESQNVTTMVMTGAGTGPVKYNWNEHFSEAQMKELGEKGYLTENRSEASRKTVVIDKQMLLDFEQFEQEELLKRIICPVLIMHGDDDWEEELLSGITRRGMIWLSDDSELKIIEGADHSFMNHLDIVESFAVDWFLEHFPIAEC